MGRSLVTIAAAERTSRFTSAESRTRLLQTTALNKSDSGDYFSLENASLA